MASVLNRKWTWQLSTRFGNVAAASVKVVAWDADSTTPVVSVLTDASGLMAEQTLFEAIYTITDTTTIATDLKTPHVISCVKYGLLPFALNINFDDTRSDTFYLESDNYITESVQSTVAAYTGISVDHTLDSIDITSNHSTSTLYDYMQNEVYVSPQKLFPGGILTTSDGNNYNSVYDIDFSGGLFDGTSSSLTADFSVTGGDIKNLSLIGAGSISSAAYTTFTNLEVIGTLDFGVGGDFTLDGGGITTVTNSSGSAVIVRLSNGAYVTNNTGPNITIISETDLVIGGLRINTEVRIYKKSDGSLLDGIENVVDTDFIKDSVQYYKFTFTFNAAELNGTEIEVAVFNVQYIPIFGNYTLTSNYVYWPFVQQYDRTYKNP